MSAIAYSRPTEITPEHPLYSPSQVFLWLPGFPGEQVPYCSYNHRRLGELAAPWEWNHVKPEPTDHNGAAYSPPFPVSPETYICWHRDVTPPFPYHPIPIVHSLSRKEFLRLARVTRRLMGERASQDGDLGKVLRNDNKIFVIAALSHMHLLSGFVPVGS